MLHPNTRGSNFESIQCVYFLPDNSDYFDRYPVIFQYSASCFQTLLMKNLLQAHERSRMDSTKFTNCYAANKALSFSQCIVARSLHRHHHRQVPINLRCSHDYYESPSLSSRGESGTTYWVVWPPHAIMRMCRWRWEWPSDTIQDSCWLAKISMPLLLYNSFGGNNCASLSRSLVIQAQRPLKRLGELFMGEGKAGSSRDE